jgi:phosphohistidine phosphatase
MHRLILMRHGEAEASSPEGDLGRGLTDTGRGVATRMGLALAERGAKPDMALVSSARRTRETWEAASAAFGDVVLEIDRAVYDADSTELRGMIEAAEDRAGCVMMVGHNPAIHQLAVDLMIEQAAAPSMLERLTGGFPPGSVVVFAIDAAGRPRYETFLRPGDLG